jgi:hypothetical protein
MNKKSLFSIYANTETKNSDYFYLTQAILHKNIVTAKELI